jgi:hypothetical protein
LKGDTCIRVPETVFFAAPFDLALATTVVFPARPLFAGG